MLRILFAIPIALVPLAGTRAAEPDMEFFEKTVRPILAENCFGCHGPAKQKAELRLDGRAAILKGGDTGPAIDLAKPEKSLLLEVVGYAADTKMPPNAKLNDERIAASDEVGESGCPLAERRRFNSDRHRAEIRPGETGRVLVAPAD